MTKNGKQGKMENKLNGLNFISVTLSFAVFVKDRYLGR